MQKHAKSETNVWCKYCKKFVSANKIQLKQHQLGRAHIAAEERYVREICLKVTQVGPGAEHEAADLFERIEQKRRAELIPVVSENDSKTQEGSDLANESKQQEENDAYPAPAHAVIGEWIPVKAEKPEPEISQETVVLLVDTCAVLNLLLDMVARRNLICDLVMPCGLCQHYPTLTSLG